LKDFDIFQVINESSLTIDETFYSCEIKFDEKKFRNCSKMLNRIVTDFGICYSFNMQGFKTIFNHKVIHDDFQSYRRTKIAKSLIDEELYNQTMDDDNEIVQWTPEKGYFGENPYFPYRANKSFGAQFVLTIFSKSALNFCYKSEFKVIFHRPNEIPTSFHQSYALNYREHFFRNLIIKSQRTSEELRRYSPHLRECYFEGERKLHFFNTYTKALCDFECQANFTLKKCGCVKFSMPRNKTTRVCRINEAPCYHLYQPEYTENSMIPCDCYSPCNDVSYSANENSKAGMTFLTPEHEKL
jgi:amiloride-sensitive sodium channel